MNKDKTILDFLERIKSILDFNVLQIIDNWPSDLCAIGIQKESKLIYVSTYNFLNEKEIRYDFDLELIDNANSTKINVLKKGRGVKESKLISEIQKFLNKDLKR